MSTAVALPPPAAAPAAHAPVRHTVGFLLFLLVNAALFVRPAEVVPDFVGWNIYEFLILVCLAASLPAVLQQFTAKSLEDRPVTLCVLGLFLAMILSLVAQFDFANALNWGIDFLKVVLYYVLFVGLVDSLARLRTFLFCLLAFGAVTVSLAVLEYHGVIALPNLVQIVEIVRDPVTRRETPLVRLTGSGIFHDPNELGVLTAVLIAARPVLADRPPLRPGAVALGRPAASVPLRHEPDPVARRPAGPAGRPGGPSRGPLRLAPRRARRRRRPAGAAAVPGGPADRPLDRATAPPRTASRSGATPCTRCARPRCSASAATCSPSARGW